MKTPRPHSSQQSTQTTPAPPQCEHCSAPSRRNVIAVFIALAISMFVSSLAETMTATALPTIVGDLGGVEIMQWVTTAYIMASTITMPIYGKLGDLIGRKYLMMSALAIYVIGSGICAASVNMAWLISGRFVSGCGGGGLMILSQAIIADVIPPRQRGKYLGVIGSVFSISTVLGPLLGGWFVQVAGWRWLFVFNMPLAAAAIVALGHFLHQKPQGLHAKADVWGMVTMAVAVVSLVLVISWTGSVYAWNSPEVLTAAAVFIVFETAFILIERKAAEPILPLMIFKNRNFILVTLTGFIIMIGMMGTTTYMPTYLQIVHNMEPEFAGLMTTPMTAGVMLTAVSTGFIASKTGRYKWMPVACCAVTGLGFYLMSTLQVTTSLVILGAYLFVLGFGIGLGQQILVLIVQNEFPHSMVGTATADNNFFRQIGSTIGASFVGTMFTSRLTSDLAAHLPKTDSITVSAITPSAVDKLPDAVHQVIVNGYSDALVPIFLWFVPLMAVGFVLTLFIKEHPLATKIDHTGHPGDEIGDKAKIREREQPLKSANPEVATAIAEAPATDGSSGTAPPGPAPPDAALTDAPPPDAAPTDATPTATPQVAAATASSPSNPPTSTPSETDSAATIQNSEERNTHG